ncbi:MAG: head decoration protein, partial [Chromatiaceae bacterium]
MTLGDAFTVVVTAAGTPVLVGTGTGTVSGVSLGRLAQPGTYKVRLTATGATALFEVIGPDGASVGHGNVATPFTSDHVNFTLANGGTMTLGDYFNIIVAGYPAPQAKLWDPGAVDGTQEAWGVLFDAAAAASAAVDAVAIVRAAEVALTHLAWQSTVTAAQKTEAYRQLGAVGVIARS